VQLELALRVQLDLRDLLVQLVLVAVAAVV
jgi:hypothetical protein